MAMVLDPNLSVRWVNPAFEARTGYSLDELRDQYPNDFTNSIADPVAAEKISTALKTHSSCSVEVRKRDRKGAMYCVDVNVQPFTRLDGTFEGFMIIATDVTQRNASELALKDLALEANENRQRLLDTIDAIPDAFAIFDADDHLVLHNQNYLDAFSVTTNEVRIGMQFEDLVRVGVLQGDFPDAIGQEEAWIAKRVAFHKNAEGEIEQRLSNNRWLRIYERMTPDGGRIGLRMDITELKIAEQRLTDIIDGAGLGLWENDVATNTTTLSHQWPAILGGTENANPSLTDDNRQQVVHPDDLKRVQEAMFAVISGDRERIEEEVRLRHRDGHWIHTLARGRAIAFDRDGKPTRISGIALDLTDRRHTEERLRAILDASSIGTWHRLSKHGDVTIDEQYAKMLGYTLDALLPWTHKRFLELLHPSDALNMIADVDKMKGLMQTDTTREFRMRHRDGHWIWVMSKARIHSWTDIGKPDEESGIHVDITERKVREAALADAQKELDEVRTARRVSDQRFADIAAVSDDWFWETDEKQIITYISSGFERTTGLPVEAMMGRTLVELGFTGKSKFSQGEWRALGKREAERERVSDFLFRLSVRPNRPPVWLRINGAPFYSSGGVYGGYRGVGSDVSALIAASERAEAANEAKSRFLANMSHELRTPLTAVLGLTELLSETQVTDPQRKMIDTIHDSGEGLLALVNDILDLAKIEAGKLTIENNVFVPADTFKKVRALFSPSVQATGLTLNLDVDPACEIERMGDANRIQQILHNLVGNAIKFTSVGKVVISGQMTSGQEQDHLVITVTDTGIGMSNEQMAKVFEEFEQAEGSTARRFGGTGLGLSITRRLVNLMAGEISLTSEIDKGTQVTVTIPLPMAPKAIQALEVPKENEPENFAGLHVLVADDNLTNQKILSAQLGKLGVDITLANDGVEACELFKPGGYDIILLDISMPKLDGIGALKAIRELECAAKVPHIPALAVTANAMQHQVDEYLEAGFSGHIAKPFRKGALSKMIAQCLTAERLGSDLSTVK